jgi:hypothetical protein
MVTDVHSGTLETLEDTEGLTMLLKKAKLSLTQALALSDFTLFRYFENVNLRMISMVMDTRLFDE